jgi:prepilin-type N-terminal cleavage/methylation domain-containing protein
MIGRRTTRRSRRKDRRGFSIPELLTAVVILGVGVVGMASSAAVMSRQMTGGAKQTTAAQVAESRFERMRARACATLVNGSAVTRGVTETWTVTPGANSTVRATVVISFVEGKTQKVRTYTSGIAC